jgi:glycosyltransferase involved in cell wall biosynthesis
MFTRDQRIDRRILLEADSLESDGWSVTLVAVPGDPAAGPDDPRVLRIGTAAGAAPGATPGDTKVGGGPWLNAYRALGRLLPVNSPGIMALRALGLSLYRGGPEAFVQRLFAQAIESQVADVYVAHDLPMLPVAVAAAERHGARCVYDSHELFAEQELSAIERRLWRRLEGRLIGRCDLVITVNRSIARELERRYGLSRVEAIHNAERVPADLVKGRLLQERLGLGPGARILLYQGGLSQGRNLEMPIRAMALVRTPGLHLVYLGDGVLAPRLARLALRQGVADRVHLVPAVPQGELLAYTASADAGLIPYRSNCLNTHYCTPNKLFEMIAAAVPIVASDLPELKRLVLDNGIGAVGDTGTPQGLASLIDGVFAGEGPGRFAEAMEEARRRIHWGVEGERLIRLYRVLAPSGDRGGAGDLPPARADGDTSP